MTTARNPALLALNIPSAVLAVAQTRRAGLFLVCGPRDSGKSTTIAALSEWLREMQSGDERASRVLLIEEIGDAAPVVDAVNKAEQSHFVLATMRANSISSALGELVACVPPGRLSQTFIGIASQRLLLRASGAGRVPAFEVLPFVACVQTMIRERKLEQIPGFLEMPGGALHVQSLNVSLLFLAHGGFISEEEALLASPSPDRLRERLRQLQKAWQMPRRPANVEEQEALYREWASSLRQTTN